MTHLTVPCPPDGRSVEIDAAVAMEDRALFHEALNTITQRVIGPPPGTTDPLSDVQRARLFDSLGFNLNSTLGMLVSLGFNEDTLLSICDKLIDLNVEAIQRAKEEQAHELDQQ